MLDFKVLSAKLTEGGLWEKPLNQFDKHQIIELAHAIHSAEMKAKNNCGTCHYQSWKGLNACCLHPNHPCLLSVWHWGSLPCKEWSDFMDKEIGPHKLDRPAPVSLDEVQEG